MNDKVKKKNASSLRLEFWEHSERIKYRKTSMTKTATTTNVRTTTSTVYTTTTAKTLIRRQRVLRCGGQACHSAPNLSLTSLFSSQGPMTPKKGINLRLLLRTSRRWWAGRYSLGRTTMISTRRVLGHWPLGPLICSHRSLIRFLHTACFARFARFA